MTAAAAAGAPVASGAPGGEDPLRCSPPAPARPDPGRRAAGGGVALPAPTWPRCAADPIAGAVTPGAPAASGRGSVGAGRPLAGARGSAAARAPLAAPPWPPRQAAPSRRPLPLPAAPPPRQARRARPGQRRGRRRGHSHAAHLRAGPCPPGSHEGAQSLSGSGGRGSGPHVVLSPRDPQRHAWAVQRGVRTVVPRSAHVPSTCRARAAGARLRAAQPPVPTWRRRAAQVLQRRRPHLVFPTFRELN